MGCGCPDFGFGQFDLLMAMGTSLFLRPLWESRRPFDVGTNMGIVVVFASTISSSFIATNLGTLMVIMIVLAVLTNLGSATDFLILTCFDAAAFFAIVTSLLSWIYLLSQLILVSRPLFLE